MSMLKQIGAFKNDIERMKKYHGADMESVPLREKLECLDEDVKAVAHYTQEFLNFIGGGMTLEMPYILAGMRQAYKNLKKAVLIDEQLKGRYKALCETIDRFLLSEVQLVKSSSKEESTDNAGE